MASSSSSSEREVGLLIVDYLKSLCEKDSSNETVLNKAIVAIEESFALNDVDGETYKSLSVFPTLLPEIIASGKDALRCCTVEESLRQLDNDDKFHSFVDTVKSKGFFEGLTEGSVEYIRRQGKIAAKYRERNPNAGQDLEQQAEEKKKLGNDALEKKDYSAAVTLYTEAIELSSEGPNTHIYHSNRAAAYSFMKKFDAAIDDCEASILLKPDYIKAHTRLAQCAFFSGKYDICIDASEKALQLEPDNSSARDLLNKAKAKLAGGSSSSSGAGGGSDLSALGDMFGKGGNDLPPQLAGTMNNPMMKNAMDQIGGPGGIANLMKDPAMMQMAQNMMKDPQAMQRMMGMMGGNNGGGGMPDMSSLAAMMGGDSGLGGAGSSSSGAGSSSSGKKAFKGFEN